MAELNTGWSSGFQQGMQLGQQRLRMQELRSLEAKRRFDERVAVEELTMKLEEHQADIQRQADVVKAFGKFQAMTTPTIPGPTGLPLPNPMQVPEGTAAIQAFLPIARDGKEALGILSQGALMNNRELSGAALAAQRKSSVAVNTARVAEINARTAQIQKGKQGVDPEWVRGIEWMEQRRGKPYTPEELDRMAEIHYGIEGRASVERPDQSEMEFITKQLPSARRAERQELKAKYRTDEELIAELRTQYRNLRQSTKESNTLGDDEVIRIVEGGRRAIFNSRTKQFIRYAD